MAEASITVYFKAIPHKAKVCIFCIFSSYLKYKLQYAMNFCKFNTLILLFSMLCFSYFADWAQNRGGVWTRHPELAELIPEGCTVLRCGLDASVTIHPSSINPKSFHNRWNHSYTNQFYVAERQIHLHSSFKSFFLYPCFLLCLNDGEWLPWRNGPCWSRYLWHYSGRAMGWTLEGTAESFGRDRRANWSGKLWGQH